MSIHAAQFGTRIDSDIEARFARDARALKFPPWQRNYRFIAGRKFELDFAWPTVRCAVEIDGHVHRIRDRFDTDREKGALAILEGWTIMHLTGLHIRDGRGVEWAQRMLEGRFLPFQNAAGTPPRIVAREVPRQQSADAYAVSADPYTDHSFHVACRCPRCMRAMADGGAGLLT